MLARRFVSPSSPLVRSLSTSAPHLKSPSLADVTPDHAHEFDTRQEEFRKAQRAAAQAKKEADSKLRSQTQQTKTSNPPPPPSSPPEKPLVGTPPNPQLSLGSFSTAEAAREKAQENESSKRKGALASLIYGTKEGREMDREIEKSFSQVLARGKYMHSIVFHDVKPDKVDEYIKLVGWWYPKVAQNKENHVNLVGSWRTEVGDCDTFVHIWEYQRYDGYHRSLHNIAAHPEFPDFDAKLRTLINSKKSSLMQEFSFWPTTPPRKLGGVFELRSYTLHPGNLLEWEQHWRKGLKARREVMEGVGAWFVQIGDLNTVHHLWQFADLEERKARREMSWGVEGWADTVHKTVPLIQTMKSKILIPMQWSPVS